MQAERAQKEATRRRGGFAFHNTKQSPAEHVDMKKTLPGRQAAIMFSFSSRPNDAVLAVKHSSTQSDNNELSAAAARNYCCKTKVLDCVWELRADYLARCKDVQPRPLLYTYTLLF